jgi:head-tail adaptor
MRSGEFNRLVTILTTAAAQDTVGQPTGAWSTLCTRWAKITYQSGIQVLKADSVGSVAKAAIRLRGYRTIGVAR